MSEPLQGEIVNHPSQKFYQPSPKPKLFWTGCLGPILVLGMFIYLIYQGATSDFGLDLIRGFIVFIVIFLLFQLFFGGGIFRKGKGTLKAMLLANASVILLIIMLTIIGLATVIQNIL